MPLLINDRVLETSTSTGTGTFTLAGAFQGYQTFLAGIGGSNTTYYTIVLPNSAEYETGLGTLDAGGTVLTRTTVYQSSNSNNAVAFSAGTKLVFCDYLASKGIFKNADGIMQVLSPALNTAGTTGTSFSVPNTVAVFYSNVNGYSDVNTQNINAGISASTDIVATANNGSTNFIDMGINSSGFADAGFTITGPNDGYLYTQGSATGGNLAIGTGFAGRNIKFFQGGTTSADEVARFTSATNNLLVGTTVDGATRIRAAGIIESINPSGGFRFPDGSTQTTASVAPRAITGGLNIGLQTLPAITVVTVSTSAGQQLVTYTTATPHNLQAQQTVTIANANPGTYNGSFSAQYISATQFAVVLAAAPGSYVSGATASSYFPQTSQTFTFSDALATTSSVISIVPSASTANNALGGDELEMDGISVAGSCTINGTINVYVYANGPLAGIRNFNYTLS
jgi:hypothetical protein